MSSSLVAMMSPPSAKGEPAEARSDPSPSRPASSSGPGGAAPSPGAHVASAIERVLREAPWTFNKVNPLKEACRAYLAASREEEGARSPAALADLAARACALAVRHGRASTADPALQALRRLIAGGALAGGTPAWDPDAPEEELERRRAETRAAEDAFEAFPTASTSTSSSPAAAAAAAADDTLAAPPSTRDRHAQHAAILACVCRCASSSGDDPRLAPGVVAVLLAAATSESFALRGESLRAAVAAQLMISVSAQKPEDRAAARAALAQTINKVFERAEKSGAWGLSPPNASDAVAPPRGETRFSETRFSEPTRPADDDARDAAAREEASASAVPSDSTSNGLRTGSSIAPNTSGPASDALLVLYALCDAASAEWSGGGDGAQGETRRAAAATAAMDLIRQLLEGPSAPRWLAALRDRLAAPLCVAILRGARGAEDSGTSSARETTLALEALARKADPKQGAAEWFHLGRKPKPKAGSRGSSHSKTEGASSRSGASPPPPPPCAAARAAAADLPALASAAFAQLVLRARASYKAEIGALFPAVALAPLERDPSDAASTGAGGGSGVASLRSALVALRLVRRLAADPQVLVDLFVNYDCDERSESPNAYERMVSALAGATAYGGVPEAQRARDGATQCVVSVVQSLRAWHARGDEERAGGRTRGARARREPNGDMKGKRVDGADASFASEDSESASEGEETGLSAGSETGQTSAGSSPSTSASESARFGAAKTRKASIASAVSRFDSKPSASTLAAARVALTGAAPSDDPEVLAAFLRSDDRARRLDESSVGEFLGAEDGAARETASAFASGFDFAGAPLDVALRAFLRARFRIPGEAQKIDRVMETFAGRFCACNPRAFDGDSNAAYVLAFAVMMLNTDAHNPSMAGEARMTKSDFAAMATSTEEGRGMDAGEIGAMYDRVVKDEIRMEGEGEGGEGEGGEDARAAGARGGARGTPGGARRSRRAGGLSATAAAAEALAAALGGVSSGAEARLHAAARAESEAALSAARSLSGGFGEGPGEQQDSSSGPSASSSGPSVSPASERVGAVPFHSATDPALARPMLVAASGAFLGAVRGAFRHARDAAHAALPLEAARHAARLAAKLRVPELRDALADFVVESASFEEVDGAGAAAEGGRQTTPLPPSVGNTQISSSAAPSSSAVSGAANCARARRRSFRTEAAKTLCEMVASERGTLAGRWREALAAISDAEREGGDAWVAEMTLVEEERAGGGGAPTTPTTPTTPTPARGLQKYLAFPGTGPPPDRSVSVDRRTPRASAAAADAADAPSVAAWASSPAGADALRGTYAASAGLDSREFLHFADALRVTAASELALEPHPRVASLIGARFAGVANASAGRPRVVWAKAYRTLAEAHAEAATHASDAVAAVAADGLAALASAALDEAERRWGAAGAPRSAAEAEEAGIDAEKAIRPIADALLNLLEARRRGDHDHPVLKPANDAAKKDLYSSAKGGRVQKTTTRPNAAAAAASGSASDSSAARRARLARALGRSLARVDASGTRARRLGRRGWALVARALDACAADADPEVARAAAEALAPSVPAAVAELVDLDERRLLGPDQDEAGELSAASEAGELSAASSRDNSRSAASLAASLARAVGAAGVAASAGGADLGARKARVAVACEALGDVAARAAASVVRESRAHRGNQNRARGSGGSGSGSGSGGLNERLRLLDSSVAFAAWRAALETLASVAAGPADATGGGGGGSGGSSGSCGSFAAPHQPALDALFAATRRFARVAEERPRDADDVTSEAAMNRVCARLWSAFSDALVPALLDLPLRRERASKATDSWERTNRACLDWADARLDATLAPAIALCADHPGAAEALLPTLADALPPFAASGRDALAEKACEAAAGILGVAAAGRGSVRRAEDQKKLNAKEGVPLDVLSAARDGAVETLRAAARQIRGDAFAADIKNGFEKGAERGGSRGGGSRGVSADDDASARRHAAVAAMHAARYAAEALAREASRDLGDDEPTPHAVRVALLDVLGELYSDASAANLASVEALADADDSRSKKNGDKAPHTPYLYFPRGPNPLMRVELSAGKVLLGALTAEIGAETARLQAVVSEESSSSSDGGLRSSGRLAALRSRLVAHAERAVALAAAHAPKARASSGAFLEGAFDERGGLDDPSAFSAATSVDADASTAANAAASAARAGRAPLAAEALDALARVEDEKVFSQQNVSAAERHARESSSSSGPDASLGRVSRAVAALVAENNAACKASLAGFLRGRFAELALAEAGRRGEREEARSGGRAEPLPLPRRRSEENGENAANAATRGGGPRVDEGPAKANGEGEAERGGTEAFKETKEATGETKEAKMDSRALSETKPAREGSSTEGSGSVSSREGSVSSPGASSPSPRPSSELERRPRASPPAFTPSPSPPGSGGGAASRNRAFFDVTRRRGGPGGAGGSPRGSG